MAVLAGAAAAAMSLVIVANRFAAAAAVMKAVTRTAPTIPVRGVSPLPSLAPQAHADRP